MEMDLPETTHQRAGFQFNNTVMGTPTSVGVSTRKPPAIGRGRAGYRARGTKLRRDVALSRATAQRRFARRSDPTHPCALGGASIRLGFA